MCLQHPQVVFWITGKLWTPIRRKNKEGSPEISCAVMMLMMLRSIPHGRARIENIESTVQW